MASLPTTAASLQLWQLYFERDGPPALGPENGRLSLVDGLVSWWLTPGLPFFEGMVWSRQTVVVFSFDEFQRLSPYPDIKDALAEAPDDVHGCLGMALCILRAIHTRLLAPAAAAFAAQQQLHQQQQQQAAGGGGLFGGGPALQSQAPLQPPQLQHPTPAPGLIGPHLLTHDSIAALLGGGPLATEADKMVGRIVGVPALTPLVALKAEKLDRFVCVRGTVTRVSSSRPIVRRLPFVCGRCGAETAVLLTAGKVQFPAGCSDPTCVRSKAFQPLYEGAVAADMQRVQLQEAPDSGEPGAVPRTVEAELCDDLCDAANPGDTVTISGVLRAVETEVARGKGTARGKSVFLLYIEATAVQNHRLAAGDERVTPAEAAGRVHYAGGGNGAGGADDGLGGGVGGAGGGGVGRPLPTAAELAASLHEGGGGGGALGASAAAAAAAAAAAGNRSMRANLSPRPNTQGGGRGAGAGAGGSSSSAGAAALPAPTAGPVNTGALGFGGFTERDLRAIAMIRCHRDPASLIVASMVPSIFGQETVKLGMLLGLFGGTPRAASAWAARRALMSRVNAATAGSGGEGGGNATVLADESPLAALAAVGGAGQSQLPTAGSGGQQHKAASGLPSSGPLSFRSDSHILVVGDPGMGKSHMLTAIAGLAPRGVYVSGTTSTATGLTVTMGRDPLTGDPTLEAGALVMSDSGICCIDEFDKMTPQHAALLEAMEQQRVSVAKAGLVSSLAARTAVIAAANPRHGSYNRGKTIVENLKMHPAILSRFDLVFILIDRKDEGRDREVARKVMDLHRGSSGSGSSSAAAAGAGGGGQRWQDRVGGGGASQAAAAAASQASEAGGGGGGFDVSATTQAEHARAVQFASSRLGGAGAGASAGGGADAFNTSFMGGSAFMGGDDHGGSGRPEPLEARVRRGVVGIRPEELVPQLLLRKYVAFARRHVFPYFTDGALGVLCDFYVELRAKHSSADATPITTRQMEAMLRLCEARAKMEMREAITPSDAADVVELMGASLFDAAQDEFGVVDFTRGPMSNTKAVKVFVAHLAKAAKNRGDAHFAADELERFGRDMQLGITDFKDFLEKLNMHGYLLATNKTVGGRKVWRLTGSVM